MIKFQIEPITQLKDWLFANKIGEVGENLIESESRSFWTMTFCGDKARKGCVDSAAAFVAKEKEGENDFCLSLVIAFVTLPPKRVLTQLLLSRVPC